MLIFDQFQRSQFREEPAVERVAASLLCFFFNLHSLLSTMRRMKPSELFDLSSEVAVVVGATGALGGALAQGLGEAGARVAVLGRNQERGQSRVKEIEAGGGDASFFAADAVSKASLESARVAIEKAYGPVSILVNAAGGNDPKVTVSAERSFEQISLADWQANFDLNVVGGVRRRPRCLVPAWWPGEEGASSILPAFRLTSPLSRVVTYSAAKAAVLNLTLFLARGMGSERRSASTLSRQGFPR